MSLGTTRHRQACMPSLLDRLLDDAPGRPSERPEDYAPDAKGMLAIIRRDLGLLLNTTNFEDEPDVMRHPAVAASVVNYGLPALSGGYLPHRNWEDVERRIRTAIVRFEPRLIPESLRLRPLHDTDPVRYNCLAFEIEALVHWSPYPLELRIQSALDMERNQVTFEQATHAGH
ncbi:type VI secretion system baseplate subunit TssE [Burkholderia glumae]|uniref:Type VI secretion system baseplate subunit TssE n=1 Tax=Burkholderia glumae TaxID=337 RepID=A0AAQ0BT94_BURGL|nr:type VI secretion system baseplate subunit TssE [Burkholderia glumae]ACR30646.1 type VI secretion system lysozyme-related protein [Burkholderia glumae BGR1]AJY64465.1 lysozyme family protein [Burkholderia glumae LMG 2196 = ATCC 33617]KHJ64827.1 cytoplasmic protein [Burkholderia glumae]MCM2484065.1 type VI secretion system baseplate subunit TssE [Burkholderia glumae]MCM2509755.1 type VI secretion system baseplate subunit TssE [Burkholderia glumae]